MLFQNRTAYKSAALIVAACNLCFSLNVSAQPPAREEVVQPIRNETFNKNGDCSERKQGGIGFSAIRGGGIVGDHDVRFIAEREVLTLSHQAFDRAVFADGALAAALWVADKPPGLYSMRDVLGL